jgi:hypothetical protein
MPSEESKLGALWMSFPDSVKLGTYKYTDGLFLKVTSGDLPVYHAKYDEVNVTITKIGSLGSYGEEILRELSQAFSIIMMLMQTIFQLEAMK